MYGQPETDQNISVELSRPRHTPSPGLAFSAMAAELSKEASRKAMVGLLWSVQLEWYMWLLAELIGMPKSGLSSDVVLGTNRPA
jgi:hypothetical protein